MPHPELQALRNEVDLIDSEVVELLAKRFEITAKIGNLKARESLNPVDPNREADQIKRYEKLAATNGLNPQVIMNIFRVIIDDVVSRHREINK